MAKIRTVKPELFRHEELFEAEKKSSLPLRLIFIGLFTAVDRDGRFRWKPKQLKLDIMPYDDIDFEMALNILYPLNNRPAQPTWLTKRVRSIW